MSVADQTCTDTPQRTRLTSVPPIDTAQRSQRADVAARPAVAGPLLTVAIKASDTLSADGARAWFEAAGEVQVISWSQRQYAQAAVVLAHDVTAQVLASIDEASTAPHGQAVPVVLVADGCNERQLLDAVDRGVVAVLLRSEISYRDVVEAVQQSLKGGSLMPAAVVRTLVERQQSFRAQPQPQTWPFAPREVEVLRYLSEGLSTADVANCLNYSERTIKNIVHEVVQRLDLRNRTHAVAYAIRCGVV